MKAKKITNPILAALWDYTILTFAAIILIIGVYVFKYPNHFSFGGVSGFTIVLAAVGNYTASQYGLVINFILIIIGFIFLGKDFGIRTVYMTAVQSIGLYLCEIYFPMDAPLTNQPVLELMFAILLPAVASAIVFNHSASTGGTDIIAMIVKRHSSLNIGTALLATDILTGVAAWFVFGPETGLFSFAGLIGKSLGVDMFIESLNRSKFFTIICDHPDDIKDYILHHLGRSATIYTAEGAYTGKNHYIIMAIMKPSQAVELRNFIRKRCPDTFIAITNSSEIIGRGFRTF